MKEEEIIRFPIEDSIDLHTFRPSEVKDLLNDYLEAASEKGFEEVRIIHGKGIRCPAPDSPFGAEEPSAGDFVQEAGPEAGGWGATVAVLRKSSE